MTYQRTMIGMMNELAREALVSRLQALDRGLGTVQEQERLNTRNLALYQEEELAFDACQEGHVEARAQFYRTSCLSASVSHCHSMGLCGDNDNDEHPA